jgi:hypothetical protein
MEFRRLGIPSIRNSVNFFYFCIFRMLCGIAENSVEFRDFLFEELYILVLASASLPFCLSVYVSFFLSFFLYLQVSLSVSLTVFLPLSLFVSLSDFLSVYLRLSVCLSPCLSLFLFKKFVITYIL